MFLTLPYLNIDPVAVAVGPLVVRWYALAYLAGFILGWRYCLHLANQGGGAARPEHYDEFLSWVVFGTILGGRLGYVLFYNPVYYLDHPEQALMVWHGGMSFHGGFLGVVVAGWLFCRHSRLPALAFGDLLACAAPIGLFFGRIANFVNGELFGRIAPDADWAMVFPRGGPLPRHPSQLYEAALEGVVLFLLLAWLSRLEAVRARPGLRIGVFLAGYGAARCIVEFFREPDAQLGFLFAGATMGQLLSLPMIIGGLGMMLWAGRQQA